MDDQNKGNSAPTKESKKAGAPNQTLRKARELRGWTQQELADKLGTTPLAINRWEQGKTFPSSFYRTKLCKVFETSVEALGLVREAPIEATMQEEDLPAQEQPVIVSAPAPSQHPANKGVWLTGTVVVLLIGIGVGLFLPRLLPSSNPRPTPSFSATRQPSPQATTPELNIASPTGTPFINDSLNTANTQGQWGAGKICTFKEQVYYVRSIGANYCIAEVAQFSDIFYQIEVTIRQGQRAGITFRADTDSNLYYFFVTIDGHYGLELIKDQPQTRKMLKSGFSSAIQQGNNHPNTLTITTRGTTFTLWINGQRVGKVQDSTYTTGYVGVCVGSDDIIDPGQSVLTIATYRNAKVWKLN